MRTGTGTLIFVLAIIGGVFAMIVTGALLIEDDVAKCRAAGGEPLRSRDGVVCLRPELILRKP